MVSALLSTCVPLGLGARRSGRAASRGLVVRADNRPLREFNEESGKVSGAGGSSGSAEPAGKEDKPKFLYADEQPPPRDTMSPEMKAKLRQEYLGLGGSPNTAMGGNYFLNIIIIVSVLAVLSKLFGYI